MFCYQYIYILLRRFYVDIFFHKFKNVIKKSVYWIYQPSFNNLKDKKYFFRLFIKHLFVGFIVSEIP